MDDHVIVFSDHPILFRQGQLSLDHLLENCSIMALMRFDHSYRLHTALLLHVPAAYSSLWLFTQLPLRLPDHPYDLRCCSAHHANLCCIHH